MDFSANAFLLSLLRKNLSPLPLAGEGWGDGSTCFAVRHARAANVGAREPLTLPSPASGRGESYVGSMCLTSNLKRSLPFHSSTSS